MFYQIFLPPNMKRRAMITYTHGIFKPHKLPNNDLRLDLKKLEIIRKVSKLPRMIA